VVEDACLTIRRASRIPFLPPSMRSRGRVGDIVPRAAPRLITAACWVRTAKGGRHRPQPRHPHPYPANTFDTAAIPQDRYVRYRGKRRPEDHLVAPASSGMDPTPFADHLEAFKYAMPLHCPLRMAASSGCSSPLQAKNPRYPVPEMFAIFAIFAKFAFFALRRPAVHGQMDNAIQC
jgi:hypothetical protein